MPNLFKQKHGEIHYSFPIFTSIFKGMAPWDDNDQCDCKISNDRSVSF